MPNTREIMELQNLAGMGKFRKLSVKQAMDREKLIKLIRYCTSCEECRDADIAGHLIANGVMIPVQCKDCAWYRKHEGGVCVNPKCVKSWYGCPVPAEHYCSYGERRE